MGGGELREKNITKEYGKNQTTDRKHAGESRGLQKKIKKNKLLHLKPLLKGGRTLSRKRGRSESMVNFDKRDLD